MSLLSELKPDDTRPQITGFMDKKQDYLSEYENEESKKILREYTQKNRETILDLTLNQIIENGIQYNLQYFPLKVSNGHEKFDLR